MYVHCDTSMEGTYELVGYISYIYIYTVYTVDVLFPQKVVEQLRGCLLSTKPVDRHRHSDVELTVSPLSATFSAGRLPATFLEVILPNLEPNGASPQPNQHFWPKNPWDLPTMRRSKAFILRDRSQSPTCKAFQLDDLTTWNLRALITWLWDSYTTQT